MTKKTKLRTLLPSFLFWKNPKNLPGTKKEVQEAARKRLKDLKEC